MPPISDRHSPLSLRRTATVARRSRPERRRSMLLLVVLLLLWSLCLGIGLAQATEPRSPNAVAQTTTPAPTATPAQTANPMTQAETAAIGTVDVVPEQFQRGQTLYLQNCATCHIGLPPAVLPSETWRRLIQDPEHYGATIRPLDSIELQILWQYLREYSRPQAEGDSVPYRVYQSKIFRALHPRVEFASKVNLNSCVSCHPGAGQYNFRQLSAEWQNAP